MTRFALVTATLAALYLLVLASLAPGDVLVGAGLGAAIAAASGRRSRGATAAAVARRLAGVPRLAAGTLGDLVRGTWVVVRHVLGPRRRGAPGIVAVPVGERTRTGVVAWAWFTALSPDEIVVDVDEARGVMLVHVLDARDPRALRARHRDTYRRRQRRVLP